MIPIGVRTENGLEPNKTIISPRSPVYLLDDLDSPMEFLASKTGETHFLNAYLEGHETWFVPVLKEYISYHVGVFGSTGSGKSWLARYVLTRLYRECGYSVLILDWSGTDYAPLFPGRSISISEIQLDIASIYSYLSSISFDFGGNNSLRDAFDEFLDEWHEEVAKTSSDPVQLYETMKSKISGKVDGIKRDDYRESARRAFRRVFRRLKPEALKPLMGRTAIEEILQRLGRDKTLVIDMGGVTSSSKLSFFLALSSELYRLMDMGEHVNTALVVDEAPQYAPWEPRGIQAETTEMIKNLAALGRKRGLNITLISQGIRGEIGINAAVRRNLNTYFIGRIHPLDASGEGGAAEWLEPYGVKAEQLLQLKPGRFYISGIMNPSPIPLLLTFSPGGWDV
jgi:DNA helicase HerA-like ATPase